MSQRKPANGQPHWRHTLTYVSEITESLKKCRERIHELEAKLERERNKRTRLECALREYHAQPEPIRKLPPEIMSYIFLELVEEDPTELTTLALVCRKWRRLTSSNPLLWRRIFISSTGNIKYVKNLNAYMDIFLKRSQAVSLDIRIDFANLKTPTDYFRGFLAEVFRDQDYGFCDRYWEWDEGCPIDDGYRNLFKGVVKSIVGAKGKNMNRFRSLHITLPDEDGYSDFIDQMWPIFSVQASNMVELTIEGGWEESQMVRYLTPSFLNPIRLEKLVIPDRFPLSAFDLRSTALKRLSLYETSDWSNYPQLSSFRYLVSLKYIVGDIGEHGPMDSSTRKIRLPLLQTLSLGGLHRADILNLFELPSITTVRLLENFDFDIPFSSIDFFAKVLDLRLVLSRFQDKNFLQELIPHLRTVSSITVRESFAEKLINGIKEARMEYKECLPVLKTVYRGDENGEQAGNPIYFSKV